MYNSQQYSIPVFWIVQKTMCHRELYWCFINSDSFLKCAMSHFSPNWKKRWAHFHNHFHMSSIFLWCSYAGHAAVSIKISRFEAGVKDLQFKATLRVVLKPLLKHPPFLGGIQLYFLTQPVSVEQHDCSLFYGHIHN